MHVYSLHLGSEYVSTLRQERKGKSGVREINSIVVFLVNLADNRNSFSSLLLITDEVY